MDLNRHTEAIAVFDDLIRRFGTATEVPIRELVASAHAYIALSLRRKGHDLTYSGRHTEAIAVYDDLIGRFGTVTEEPIGKWVAIALYVKGEYLVSQGCYTAAIGVFDDLIGRFGTATEKPGSRLPETSFRELVADARRGVALALRQKGDDLVNLGHHTKAIAVYDDLIGRFGTATENSIREQVDMARVSRIRVGSTTAPTPKNSAMSEPPQRVFIVHGHDDAARESVARLVERAGLEAVILREQPNQGRTIIEKFEKHSETAGFAIVLLTPDDVGGPDGTAIEQLRPRARQNVVAELFFFIGKLGRNKVCALVKGNIELPSDFAGVVYEQMDEAGHWQLALAQEMVSAGLIIDLNKLFRR
jgi:predicted nucleotide-binding protein